MSASYNYYDDSLIVMEENNKLPDLEQIPESVLKNSIVDEGEKKRRNKNNEKLTLRQRLKMMNERDATELEIEKLKIIQDSYNKKRKTDDLNIMKIFPKEMLQMPVFTNEYAVETIQEMIKLGDDEVLRAMPFVCDAMQRLLMKTRGIYTRKDCKGEK